MFLNHYGLHAQPFGVTPDHRFLYASATHREALASLYYGIRSGRGFLALIAQPGMGKTTLLAHLLENLRESARTAFLFQSQCDSREFLRFLLADLGASGSNCDLVQMQEKLNEILIQELNVGRRVVIVIDEAQGYDNSVLETIRMLSNFETPRAKLMQIILAGQPQLADRLASADLVQLQQRISIVCRLTPLTGPETAQYISHRMRVAGYTGGPLFTPEALRIISSHSGGIPRNINNLCFHALTLGFAKSEKIIDATILEEVLADLDLDSIGSEGAAKESFSSDPTPLPTVISPPTKEELAEPVQAPSPARTEGIMSSPVVPNFDEFHPSQIRTYAQFSADDRDAPEPVRISSTERTASELGNGASPLPLREEPGEPVRAPSTPRADAYKSCPVAPDLHEFFPSESQTHAEFSADDWDARERGRVSGTERTASELGSGASLLPLREEPREPVRAPSTPAADAYKSCPVAPDFHEFFPSESRTHAEFSADDQDARERGRVSSTTRTACELGSGASLIRRQVSAASTVLSNLARAARSMPMSQFNRRWILVVASAVLPLVAGATTSILFSRHVRQVLANDHDLPTAVQAPPEPPLIPQANSSESRVPRDLTPGKSEPEAQRVEPTSQPRVYSTTGNNNKPAVVGRYGRVRSAGDFAVPVAPKRNQFLAEVLPLSRPLGTGSRIWEISSSAPALPKTDAPPPVAIETMEPVAPGRIGGEFVPPKLVSSGLPNYPTLAKRAGAEGDVKIRAHVDTSGHVDSMIVMPGSPILLQEAAMRALLAWKYEPAKLNGQPVSANVEVTMRFREREGQVQSQQAVVDSRSARPSGENVGSLACRVLRHSPLPVCAGASRHGDSTPSAAGKLKP